MRNELLNFKQRGTYQGYVAKFMEKLRLVPLNPAFAKDIFLSGLTSYYLRKQILRKKPTTLEDLIAEGFSEVELERLDDNKQPPDASKQKSGTSETKKQQNQFSGKTGGRKRAKSHHCQRGYHDPGEGWLKFPEKRPKSTDKGHRCKRSTNDNADYKSKYYALIAKFVVDNVEATDQPLNE
ncbi:Hypothetical protein PHPALM_3509 [Phytophthora palmivora]|uniref:Retrotransposon gag domain-containing protein n=1 Tax=Phytophthora palmivora TaxID=4796 RepID=A0A2P4YM90_9STRA|nr:Hypothetical protein PHPALM_3509 [Phytophthora palmivora]